jgi:hypothetical protein
MLAGVLKHYEPEEILFVGDRLYTDFELAKRAGCRFVLPLCGETKRTDVDALECKPEFVVNNVSEIDCHCCIDACGIFDPCLNDCCYVGDVSRDDYAPATKEQRDLLFHKMKEAGYEWNAEKKELKMFSFA